MNERIDHTNYEAWLLDRLDGMLTPDQDRELDAFLLLHPECVPAGDHLPTINDLGAHLSTEERESLKRSLPPLAAINRMNVEDHIIARLEGDLEPHHLVTLAAYLKEHPELQRVERLYALTRSEPIAVSFVAKQDLHRHLPPVSAISAYTLNDHLVAQLEGDLYPTQEIALEAYLAAHPEGYEQQRLVAATRILSERIVYTDKSDLKKGGRVFPLSADRWAVRFAAAASVAILLGLGSWFLLVRGPRPQEIVRVEPRPETPTTVQHDEERLNVAEVKERSTTKTTGAVGPPRHEPKVQEPNVVLKEDNIVRNPPSPAKVNGDVQQPLPQPIHQDPPPMKQPAMEPEQLKENLAQVPEPAPMPTLTAERTTSLRGLLASTVRETVLDGSSRSTRPLDGDDAVAAVDRGLKVVAGEHAGLSVGRSADGGVNTFQLRFGRKFGITASR